MSDPGPNKASVAKGLELKLETLLDGLKSGIPSGMSLKLGGVDYDAASLVHELEAHVEVFTDVRDAKTALSAKVLIAKGDKPAAMKLYALVRAALQALLGMESADLVKYGLKPRKAPKPRTNEQKAVASAKALKTRELRGTKGPKQKAAIKAAGAYDVTVSPVAETPPSNGPGGVAPAKS